MAQLPGDLVQRLYAAPPDEFVAARAAGIAAARAAGDRETARLIAGLRKPTVAAWLINLLALREPDLVDGLVELAADLRAAQRELRGDELRELSARRREVVSGLVRRARALALAAAPTLAAGGKLPLAEVEATLTAALADEAVAEQVRSGRLLRPVAYAGFGEVPRPRLRLVTDPGPADPGSADPGPADPGPADPGPADPDADRRGLRDANPDRRGLRDAGTDRGGLRDATTDRADRRATAADGGRSGRRPADATDDVAADAERLAAQAQRMAAEAQRVAARARRAARRRALSTELAAAGAAVEQVAARLADATRAEERAGRELADIEAALVELQRRRDAAHGELGARKLARKAAHRDAVAARRRAGELQAAIEAVDADDADDRTD